MGDRDVVDLAAEPKVCHEISRAFAPIGFSFRFEEDSVIVRQSGSGSNSPRAPSGRS